MWNLKGEDTDERNKTENELTVARGRYIKGFGEGQVHAAIFKVNNQ